MKITRFFLFLATAATVACSSGNDSENSTESTAAPEKMESKVVNVYTHRHYETDKQLYKQFTEETGIEVKVVKAKAGELLVRLENEGKNSPADLLVTVDAARLVKAKDKGLLQPITSEVLNKNVPANLRDTDGQWYAQTVRGRVVVYSKDRVKPEELSTYEDLTNPKWANRILVRSSENVYNQSLLASIIINSSEEEAKAWAEGMVANFARAPKGNDRDQVKAIAAGQGDIAIVNTYYIGKLLASDNEEEVKAGEAVSVFFPNQGDRGTHINVSGAGVTKYAPNKANAVKLLEFLSEAAAQQKFAEANHEYPVNPVIEASDLLKSWGDFKRDQVDISKFGAANSKAVEIFDQAGWR